MKYYFHVYDISGTTHLEISKAEVILSKDIAEHRRQLTTLTSTKEGNEHFYELMLVDPIVKFYNASGPA